MIHQQQGRYDDAVKSYQESMNIFEELGNKSGIAITLHQLGMIHQHQGRYDDAVKSYKESMKISEKLGDKSGISNSLGQMGRIYYVQKNYKKALRSYLFAFIIFNELNSTYKDIVNKWILELKDDLGDELFNKYYQETIDEQREKDSN